MGAAIPADIVETNVKATIAIPAWYPAMTSGRKLFDDTEQPAACASRISAGVSKLGPIQ